ncbi:MAG: acyl--CoA ligase, partial [Ignavibacteriales bacterium]|nr:acyl--CoA ligase [Ignavibacteriales bacterium]
SSHPSLTKKIFNARSLENLPFHLYQVPYANIGTVLEHQVSMHRDKPWCIFYSDLSVVVDENGRSEITYGEFYERVGKTVNYLLQNGIRRGDKVATISFNHLDTVVQYFAIWTIGAVAVPINIGEDDVRIEYILSNSETKLTFVREHYLQRIETLVESSSSLMEKIKLVRVGNSQVIQTKKEYELFETQISNLQPPIILKETPTLDDEALIVYTSGTTGLPKGVVLVQYNLLIDAKEISSWHKLTSEQRMMCVLPLHHVNGIIVTLLTPLYAGASVVLNQKFHSNKFFERVKNENVNIVSVVPTLLQFLLHEHSHDVVVDVPSLQHIICGAGPLTVELAIKFEERFHVPIMHGYGLSETTCYSCFLPVDLSNEEHTYWLKDFGFPSIGVPIPCNEMAIHDENGNEMREGEKGEIVIRGHNVMKYYFQNDEVNEKTFAFNWFRSGDEGFYKLDEKGRKFFFITGRLKELIIRGGSNISPFAIDEVLMNIEGVAAGLAVGFENDWYGEEVGAYVKLKEGVSLSEKEIMLHCRKHFSFSISPKVIVFGNDIPVTSTGKYQRNKLKPLFEKWKSVQFKKK